MTIDSHLRFGEPTHAEALTEEVIADKHVWHRKNCINCHTLLGEPLAATADLSPL